MTPVAPTLDRIEALVKEYRAQVTDRKSATVADLPPTEGRDPFWHFVGGKEGVP